MITTRTGIALLLTLATGSCAPGVPAAPDAAAADTARDDGATALDAGSVVDSAPATDADLGGDAGSASPDASAADSAGWDAVFTVDAGSVDGAVAVDAGPGPDVIVAVDAGNPCEGATPCEQASRACEADTLVICAPRYAGSRVACLAETRVDCASRGQSCDSAGEPTCMGTGLCPAARAITCDSGALVDTTLVSRGVLDDYSCDPDSSAYSTFDGREALYALTVDRDTRVTVTATPLDGVARAYQLFVLRAQGQACNGDRACEAPPQDGYAASQQQSFEAQAGETFYLSYDLKGNFMLEQTTALELRVQCQDPECGNGLLEVGEACDDDNTEPADGCSVACAIEEGWACDTASGQASACHSMDCGDGVLDEGEACDDDNSEDQDGCSATCTQEPGWHCSGEPSRCYAGGDSCTEAILLEPGSHTLDTGAFSDSGVDLACDYAGNSGRDVYFKVNVPARTLLSARLQADWYEAELFALSGCSDLAHSCQRLGDLDLYNGSAQPVERLLLVDTSSYSATPASGPFSLELDLTPAAQLPAGDSVQSARRLERQSLPAVVEGDTSGLHNLYARYFNAGTACTYYTSYAGVGAGPDQVFVVEVPAGKTLRASVTTSWSGSGDTDSVLVISSSPDLENACLAYGNQEGAALQVTNSGQAAVDHYLVVDGFGATHRGSFALTVAIVD